MVKSKDDARRRYFGQSEARANIVAVLGDRFSFDFEVKALDPDGNGFFVDAVSRCKQTGWAFGWEFKRSHLYMKEFADALRQAIRYRLARIVDRRFSDLENSRLRAVAVFPDWLGEHDEDLIN